MGSRKDLHKILVGVMGEDRALNVYFQPPANVLMKYPAIVYKRDTGRTEFADNSPYLHKKRYSVTVIDANPDSDIPERVAMLPMTLFATHFTADNLNHDVYNIYF